MSDCYSAITTIIFSLSARVKQDMQVISVRNVKTDSMDIHIVKVRLVQLLTGFLRKILPELIKILYMSYYIINLLTACDCYRQGSDSSGICKKETGQCTCKIGYEQRQCSRYFRDTYS
jgi:hypothetical protein